MRRTIRLSGMPLAAALASVATADVVVETGFEDGSSWQLVWMNPVDGAGGIFPTGGNPGGQFHGLLTVFDSMSLGGFGAFDPTLLYITDYQAGEVTLVTDYRFIDDQPESQAPEVVPVILQGGRAYYPSQRTPADENGVWHTLEPSAYSLASFTNSTGVPIDFDSRVRIGVLGILPNPDGGMPVAHFALDNVLIEVVPSPPVGAAAAVLWVAYGAGRRRGEAV